VCASGFSPSCSPTRHHSGKQVLEEEKEVVIGQSDQRFGGKEKRWQWGSGRGQIHGRWEAALRGGAAMTAGGNGEGPGDRRCRMRVAMHVRYRHCASSLSPNPQVRRSIDARIGGSGSLRSCSLARAAVAAACARAAPCPLARPARMLAREGRR